MKIFDSRCCLGSNSISVASARLLSLEDSWFDLIFCLWNAENLYVVEYFSWQNPSFSLLVECFSWSCLVSVVRHGQKSVCGCVSVCTAVPLAIVH